MVDRIIIDVKWRKPKRQIKGVWLVQERRNRRVIVVRSRKIDAMAVAACEARSLLAEGRLAQVVVKNKSGRISHEWTYGKDPRRRKG